MFSYYPNRLATARDRIEKVHKTVGEIAEVSGEDPVLENLIVSLIAQKPHQLKAKALALTTREVMRVAAYIPYNYYSVDMENIFQTFMYRISEDTCRILLQHWQERYDNAETNRFLLDLIKTEESMKKEVDKMNISRTEFCSVLGSDYPPVVYGQMYKNKVFASSTSLNEKIESLSIRADSRLFSDMKFLFFTFCKREDYLSATVEEITLAAKKYGERALRAFLSNFLEKLTIKELDKFNILADHLAQYLGNYDKEKCINFFADISGTLFEKYRVWLDRRLIGKIFGYDERSLFWQDYRFVSLKRAHYSDSIIMEFEEYYITEFLGKANGPIYIYEKQQFDNHFRRLYNSYKKMDLRSMLHHRWKEQGEVGPFSVVMSNGHEYNTKNGVISLKMSHNPNPGWQGKIRTILKKRNITELVV